MAHYASETTLTALHYVAPLAVAVMFILTTLLRICFIVRRRKVTASTSVRLFTLLLVVLIGLSYAATAILYICHALVQKGWFAPQHAIVFALSSMLLWSLLLLFTLYSDGSLHWNHTSTWMLACLLEVIICITSVRLQPRRDGWQKIELAIQAVRIVMLSTLSIYKAINDFRAPLASPEPEVAENGAAKKAKKSKKTNKSKSTKTPSGATAEETQPLLANSEQTQDSDNSTQKEANGGYGTVTKKEGDTTSTTNSDKTINGDEADSDSDSGSDEEEVMDSRLKRQQENDKVLVEQQKRVEEAGGWFVYIKKFAIFLPALWPSKNRRMQSYIFVIFLLIFVSRAFHVLIPTQLGKVVDALTEVHGTGELPWKAIGWLIFLEFLGNDATIGSVKSVMTYRLSLWSFQRLDTMAFGHVMGLSMDFHDNKDSGEVIKAVQQANSLNRLVQVVFFDMAPILLDLIIAVGYLTHLFDIYCAFILAFSMLAFLLITYYGTKWSAAYRRDYTEKSRMLSTVQFQSISNWPLVSYFNRSRYESDRLQKSIVDNNAASINFQDTMYIVWVAQDIVLLFAEIAIMLLAAYRVSQGEKPVGNFVALKSFWSTITYPIWSLAYVSRDLVNKFVDAERMLQLLETQPKIMDKEGAKDIQITKGHVKFNNVNFFYDERKPTIKDVNFEVEGGKTIALVGETGSGKSTLLKLLFRFYDVTSGSVEIDGQDVRDVRLESLREAIGNVPQAGNLFNDTILENVRYARLDATEEEVQAACKAACVHEKIMGFADKYQTKVGERGVKLSGGELQRISIARVILKNPQIVLLDEATSAVDSTTEAHIQEAFAKLTKGRTTFVIAHRLSTIMDADTILVIDKGQVVERGTHDELLSINGKYQSLWETQTKKQKKAVEDASKVTQVLDY